MLVNQFGKKKEVDIQQTSTSAKNMSGHKTMNLRANP